MEMTHAERKCISSDICTLDYIWGLMQRGNAFPLWEMTHAERLMQRGNAFQIWTIYGDSCREEMHFRSGLYMGTHAERKISFLDYDMDSCR